jgi:S1-C subfamily serine protease
VQVSVRSLIWGLAAVALLVSLGAKATDSRDTLARVKRSVVAVGTFEPGRAPPFQFRGSGFAVDDGRTIVTNAHVVPAIVDAARNESLAILAPNPGSNEMEVREVRRMVVDPGSDLALLKLAGAPLAPLKIGDSGQVREGQEILMTGFPIGGILGPFAATHRGIVSAITPIAIPQGRASELEPALVRRLASGTFPVFQLDATAYPGNSGSPIYDPLTGEVLGIVNLVFVKGTKESVLAQPSGIAYAVPAAHINALLSALRGNTSK